jgi:hypothetical protein
MTDPRITDEMANVVAVWLVNNERTRATWETLTDESRDRLRAKARDLLAAVVPLIEQAVIERLAAEAGINPYGPGGTPYSQLPGRLTEVFERGAAAGVAAERARWEKEPEITAFIHEGDDASTPHVHVLRYGDSVTIQVTNSRSYHVRLDDDRTDGGPDAA